MILQCRKRLYLYYILPKWIQKRCFNTLSKDNLCCPSQHKGEGWGIIIVRIVRVGKWDEERGKLKVTSKVCDRARNRIQALYCNQYINNVNDHFSFISFSLAHYPSDEHATLLKKLVRLISTAENIMAVVTAPFCNRGSVVSKIKDDGWCWWHEEDAPWGGGCDWAISRALSTLNSLSWPRESQQRAGDVFLIAAF